MANEVRENPGKFAGGKIGEMFLGVLFMPSLISFIIVCGFFILGFTTFLGGPYGFFKFLFVIFFLGILCVVYFIRKIYRFIKSITENAVNDTIKVKSRIVE
ncbi:MAG: hypothetical protein NTZ87_03140 [Candidatus Nomurabacteria bacterium]|nr:hypothetical protein [Candidatus Nomurabacteria bacterium]